MTGNGQETLQKIERAVTTGEWKPGDPITTGVRAPADNFMQQMQSALDMLARTGVWLGKLGQHDAKELHAFAEHWRQESQQFVGDLIARKRQELAELERIIGRLGANK